jgi:heme/copper-type cytochrome/quinol oxidase subunit 1
MRARPAWLRTSTLWAGLAAAMGVMAMAPIAPTPAMVGRDAGDTYYVLSPFRFAIPLAVAAGLFAGFYFWCERRWQGGYDDRLGAAHVVLFAIGYGLISLPRLVLSYGVLPESSSAWLHSFNALNQAPLIGYLFIACGLLAFAWVCLRGLWSAMALSGDRK